MRATYMTSRRATAGSVLAIPCSELRRPSSSLHDLTGSNAVTSGFDVDLLDCELRVGEPLGEQCGFPRDELDGVWVK